MLAVCVPQMHPVLRQMKSCGGAPLMAPDRLEAETEGFARLNGGTNPEAHPRVQLKKDAAESYVPNSNILRDNEGTEGEGLRHVKFQSGQVLRESHPSQKVLSEKDFERDEHNGISIASAHLKAADMITAYEQTVKEEVNFQTSFNNHVRTLAARQEVTLGLMHLWDFISAYLSNQSSKALTAQLFLVIQHCRDEGTLKDGLLNIADPENKWLVDLINILQTIIVQEQTLSLSEKVAAINYSLLALSKHYAKKVFNTVFPPIDKEVKIHTFYMRNVIKILVLCDDLGMYRNERIERVISGVRKRELSDRELMFNLRRAMTQDNEDDEYDEEDLAPTRAPKLAGLGAGSLQKLSEEEAYNTTVSLQRHGREESYPDERGARSNPFDNKRRVGDKSKAAYFDFDYE